MFKRLVNWLQSRHAIRELSQLSDRDLADLGIARHEIDHIVRFGAAPSRGDSASARTPQQGLLGKTGAKGTGVVPGFAQPALASRG